jgi:hypothetical protein
VRPARTTLVALAGVPALASMLALAVPPARAHSTLAARTPTANAPIALRRSLNLWATIDLCNPRDQPHTVGVRGSMPGDRNAGDEIYMRFRLQLLGVSGRWTDLPGGSSPGFIRVSSAQKARQDGWSFQLTPRGKPASLRGVVTFQWRRGNAVLASVSRPTTAGHESLAGADPPNFSVATCSIA